MNKKENYFGLPSVCCRELYSNELLFRDLSSDSLSWQIRGYQPHLFCSRTGLVRCWEGCQQDTDDCKGVKSGESQVSEPRENRSVCPGKYSSFKIEKTCNNFGCFTFWKGADRLNDLPKARKCATVGLSLGFWGSESSKGSGHANFRPNEEENTGDGS